MKRNIKFPELLTQFKNEEKMILRDHLAILRTRLSNERTLFAYIRTCIYLFLGGVAFIQIGSIYPVMNLGYVSVALSGLLLVFGLIRFYMLRRQLNSYYSEIGQAVLPGQQESA
jgi:putative membrane protein